MSGSCTGMVKAGSLEDGRCGCNGVRLSGGGAEGMGEGGGSTVGKGVGNAGNIFLDAWGQ